MTLLPAIREHATAVAGVTTREFPTLRCDCCGHYVEFRGSLPPARMPPAGWSRVASAERVAHYCPSCTRVHGIRSTVAGEVGR